MSNTHDLIHRFGRFLNDPSYYNCERLREDIASYENKGYAVYRIIAEKHVVKWERVYGEEEAGE